jgi:hypothetical protein
MIDRIQRLDNQLRITCTTKNKIQIVEDLIQEFCLDCTRRWIPIADPFFELKCEPMGCEDDYNLIYKLQSEQETIIQFVEFLIRKTNPDKRLLILPEDIINNDWIDFI